MKTTLSLLAPLGALLLLGCTNSSSSGTADATDVADAADASDATDASDSTDVADATDGAGDAEDTPDISGGDDAGGSDSGSSDVEDPDAEQSDVDSACDPVECAAKATECETATCFQGACLFENSTAACDDGDPCTQGDSCLVGTCTGLPKPDCCTIQCDGKVCGPDGCDGSCGECPGNKLCGGDGTCVDGGSGGETCADAAIVPGLPFTVTWSTKGLANDHDVPALACNNYALGTYGNDAVYRYNADFTGYLTLELTGLGVQTDVYVLEDCADPKYGCSVGTSSPFTDPTLPISAPVVSGHSYWIVVDGSDPGGEFTLTLDACHPDCKDKECGNDGCGNACAYCPVLSAELCSSAFQCVCIPSCDEKACGDDGCGGSCGTCDGDETCDIWGHDCVDEAQAGDKCDDAIPMATFPFTYSGNTTGYGNDYYGWAFCAGNGTGAYLGDSAPDVTFRLEPEVATAYYITLSTTGYIPALWALPDCKNPVGCLQAGYKGFELGDEKIFIEARPGAPTFVIVSAYQTGKGPFELDAIACTTPASCPGATPGEYCSFANRIESLPFEAHPFGIQSTVDAYSLPETGPCASTKNAGDGANEDAYVFTPTQSGTYSATVDASGQLDPVLYVTTDCLSLETACLVSGDATGEAGSETVTFTADAGTPFYILVDGFTPYGGAYDLSVSGPL